MHYYGEGAWCAEKNVYLLNVTEVKIIAIRFREVDTLVFCFVRDVGSWEREFLERGDHNI